MKLACKQLIGLSHFWNTKLNFNIKVTYPLFATDPFIIVTDL